MLHHRNQKNAHLHFILSDDNKNAIFDLPHVADLPHIQNQNQNNQNHL